MIQIERVTVQPYDDEMKPYVGYIESSWTANGMKEKPNMLGLDFPVYFTSAGVVPPKCGAFWGKNTKQWNWKVR